MPDVAICGYGYVGQAYHKVFPEALIYDEPKGDFFYIDKDGNRTSLTSQEAAREMVNQCELAIICVPTDPKLEDTDQYGNVPLNTEIVEYVVDWVESKYILIKSALMPSTVDRLVEKTGKKIAVSVEYVGMGGYYIDPHDYPDPTNPKMHQMVVVGGEPEVRDYCIERLWQKMSPTIKKVRLTAKEAEITKLVENTYPALKLTFGNNLCSVANKAGVSFLGLHDGWTADPRVDGMHLRVLTTKRGWSSHCWDKDPTALAWYCRSIGVDDMALLIETMIKLNKEHLESNNG